MCNYQNIDMEEPWENTMKMIYNWYQLVGLPYRVVPPRRVVSWLINPIKYSYMSHKPKL